MSEVFWCKNCGPNDDPLGDGHGRCPACSSELIRIPPPTPKEDGITKYWRENHAKECQQGLLAG